MSTPRKPLRHHLHDYFFPHPRNGYRPHLFSATSIAVLVLAVILLEAGYLVQTKIVFLKTDFLASVLPGALVVLTNQDRATYGLAGVIEDPVLSAAARAAAEDMATKRYFSHVSPDGKTPWYWLEAAGYRYSYAGQNLAVNFTDSENVETAWMASAAHRANIMKPQYTRVGFGTATGIYEGEQTTFVVEFFATPPTSSGVGAPTERVGAAAPATPVSVLGSQIENTDPSPQGDVSVAATSGLSSWWAVLAASPLNTLLTLFTTIFAVIALSFTSAVLIRGKTQHRSVVLGGALLLLLVPGAMLFSAVFAGPIQLSTDVGAASVEAALP